jgi:trk system potassium uptake protein TrkA
MFIVIAGGGKVGAALARDLAKAEHETVLLEKDRGKAQALEDDLGSSVIPHDASEGRWLLRAGVARADLVIAVTGDDEDNLVICQLAETLSLGTARTIARINNPKNQDAYRLLGIEAIVNATDLVMSMIERDVGAASVVHLMRLRSAGLELVEMTVSESSEAAGCRIADLQLTEQGARISVVLREDAALFKISDLVLEPGDTVVAVVELDSEDALRSRFAASRAALPRY